MLRPPPPERSRLREAFAIDARSMALFRVGLAVTVLWDVFCRMPFVREFYSDEGMLPRDAVPKSARTLWHALPAFWSGATAAQEALFAITALSAIALALGWRTRFFTGLTWILVVSYEARNSLVCNAGNSVLKVLLFWSMLVDLGSCWSLDERRRRAAGEPAREPALLFSVAGVGLLLQIALIYWSTAILKWKVTWHVEGSALYYALSRDALSTSIGHALTAYPRLLRLMTFGTLALELFGPFLAFSPFWSGRLRTVAIALFMSFHFGIFLCMNVGIFPLISIVAWTVFVPQQAWSWVIARRTGRDTLTRSPLRSERFTLVQAPTLVLIALVVYWNVTTFPGMTVKHTAALSGVMSALRLEQKWPMFRHPKHNNNWYVIGARSADGSIRDVVHDRPASWDRPGASYTSSISMLWRNYMKKVSKKAQTRKLLTQYLCRQSVERGAGERLDAVEVFSVNQKIPNRYRGESRVASPTRSLLWSRTCAHTAGEDPSTDHADEADGDDEDDEE